MIKTLITHSGAFHADETFATAIMKTLYKEAKIIRTFKAPEESEDAIIYDIGGGKYDHHMSGGNGCRENGTPYASAGLIWKNYGKNFLREVYPEVSMDGINYIHEGIDAFMVEEIDAIDNGYGENKGKMSLSHIISTLNPRWDETTDSDTAFMTAVALMKSILLRECGSFLSKWTAKEEVREAFLKQEGHIMILDRFLPWQDHLYEMDKEREVLYVIFPSNREGYNLQAVPTEPGSFSNLKPLPEEWRGKRDKDLENVSGIKDTIFVHPAGFIGGAKSLKATLEMAKAAVKA